MEEGVAGCSGKMQATGAPYALLGPSAALQIRAHRRRSDDRHRDPIKAEYTLRVTRR